MTQYFKFESFVPRGETEKAYAFQLYSGRFGGNDEFSWFPKSAVIVSEPNQYGNSTCMIAKWIFKSKNIRPDMLQQMAYSMEDATI